MALTKVRLGGFEPQYVGRRNLIINGGMQVAQRGTSSTTNGMSTVDRTQFNYSGGTVTQSQESLSSGTPYTEGFHKFYRATNTSVATDTASHYRVFRQNIEDQNVAVSGWDYESTSSYITVSFWVRSSVSQEFYAYINQGADVYNFVFSIGTLSANTWTKVTKTISGNSNLSFDNDNSAGIEFNIVPFWGTNFTTSSTATDTWYAWDGASRVPDMTSTWATTSGATFDITGVQLEVGSVATPFEHRTYAEELELCKRYFQKFGGGANKTIAHVYAPSTAELALLFRFSPEMRVTPSVDWSSATTDMTYRYNNNNSQEFDRNDLSNDGSVGQVTPQGGSMWISGWSHGQSSLDGGEVRVYGYSPEQFLFIQFDSEL